MRKVLLGLLIALWLMIIPCIAHGQTVELPCPSGYSQIPSLVTLDNATGARRYYACVRSRDGDLIIQGLSGGIFFPPPPSINVLGTDSSSNFIQAPLADTNIWIGNGSNVPAAHAISGDCTMSDVGIINCNGLFSNSFPKSALVLGTDSGGVPILGALTDSHIYVGNSSNNPADVAMSGNATINDTGSVSVNMQANIQTGATYTFLSSDNDKLVSFQNGSLTTAVTLPQCGSAGFANGWFTHAVNFGTGGVVTITPTTSTIENQTFLSLNQFQGVLLICDSGSGNYRAYTGRIGFATNAQTGTSYTFVPGDHQTLVTFSNASPVAATLPQPTATSGFSKGFFFFVSNIGAGTVTITPTSSTIGGAASLPLLQGQGVVVVSDGTNYQVVEGIVSGSNGNPHKIEFNTVLAKQTVNFNSISPSPDIGALALPIKTTVVGGNETDAINELPATAVTPGTYRNTNITVDQQGRITAASNGTGTVPTSFTIPSGFHPISSAGRTVYVAAPLSPNVNILSNGASVELGADCSSSGTSAADSCDVTNQYENGTNLSPPNMNTYTCGTAGANNFAFALIGNSGRDSSHTYNGVYSQVMNNGSVFVTGTNLTAFFYIQIPAASTNRFFVCIGPGDDRMVLGGDTPVNDSVCLRGSTSVPDTNLKFISVDDSGGVTTTDTGTTWASVASGWHQISIQEFDTSPTTPSAALVAIDGIVVATNTTNLPSFNKVVNVFVDNQSLTTNTGICDGFAFARAFIRTDQ